MKALILAAGFGTRLLPYTGYLPKPLFPLANRPLVDIHIRNLEKAGCTGILINTHHLHQKIEEFIAGQSYSIPVFTRYEPQLLGTGGAIKNAADFLDNRPFMIINSDIYTDIDFRKVYEFHLNHSHPATLVLYDDPEFNTVCTDKDDFITGLASSPSHFPRNTFTGIQVLAPEILDFIPDGVFSSSIDAFQKLIEQGGKINAYMADGRWKDLGNIERYRQAAIEAMAAEALTQPIETIPLKGDGSDRRWYRLKSEEDSLILADHGIRKSDAVCEADSFVRIGQHLHRKGIPVPEIHSFDLFSGLVISEDLGDIHLQNYLKSVRDPLPVYQTVIDQMIQMSVIGKQDFDPSWAYQSAVYDRQIILEKECRYFTEAFLQGYMNRQVCFEELEEDFCFLADQIAQFGINGFMHRDFQSRNIMVVPNDPTPDPSPERRGEESSPPALSGKGDGGLGQIYVIDFQAGRIGPIQYDLASLLIDPYVNLPDDIQARLTRYCFKRLSAIIPIDEERFLRGYEYCRISRNLQMLGAFGFLSRVKGKIFFEQFIPIALSGLKKRLSLFDDRIFPKLRKII
jgi:aminoglycoside/choline kinase family phosphotransferase